MKYTDEVLRDSCIPIGCFVGYCEKYPATMDWSVDLAPVLSSYGQRSVTPSPVNRMMTSFAADFREGVDINLGVGYVNQETMPRAEIAQALDHVLSNPAMYRNALNYGGAQGSPNLIEAIRGFYCAGGFGAIGQTALERCDMLIGASGATSILMGLAHVLKPGIVVCADPMYYIYCDFLERAGFEVIAVPEDAEGMRVDLARAMVGALGERRSEIRCIYASTVGNPSSIVVSNKRRRQIVDLGVELSRGVGAAVPVVFDAAYEALIHAEGIERPVCGLEYDTEGIVYEVGSFSKILAPALRIGYFMGPRGALFDALVQNTSDMGFSAPLVVQEMAAYLIARDGIAQVAAVRREYRRRAEAIRGWMERELGHELESVSGGGAGFYYYLTFKNTPTHERSPFFRYLSRTTGLTSIDRASTQTAPRVVAIPGEHCVHAHGSLRDFGQRQLRISYGYESMERIETGIRIMGEAVRYAREASRVQSHDRTGA